MVFVIDLDRGVHMNSHPTLNMDVYMYVDDPGVYLTAHGDLVPKEIAEAAGFPVEKHEKAHNIKTAMAAAMAEVMTKFGGEDGPKLHMERGGFKVMNIGMGRYNVHGPDGDLLTKAPVPKEQAELLLAHLAPETKPKDKK